MAKKRNKVVDVNKEQYLRALFIDLEKTAKDIAYSDRAKLIEKFVNENPSNDDSGMVIRNGVPMIGNRVLITRR